MLIHDGLRHHLMQVFPKRDFDLLIDPECLDQLLSPSQSEILQLIVDLRKLDPPIQIRLLISDKRGLQEPFFELPSQKLEPREYSPTNPFDKDPRSKLLEDTIRAKRERALCSLAVDTKVDGVVTTARALLDARYPLHHDLINIVPPNELADFVEICAHGHNVFWSASYTNALFQDVYYTLAHHKGQRLVGWWRTVPAPGFRDVVYEQLRSIIHNRYPFILYARDMVRFYHLQVDHFRRHGDARLNFGLSYHLNQFYLQLWGLLDQLSLLSNYVLGLGLKQRQCGITKKNYLKAVERHKPNLRKFLQVPAVHDWIDIMSDFRHAVAHQVIPLPSEVLSDSEESKKSKEEILKILESEDEDWAILRKLAPNDETKISLEDYAVYDWRYKKRKRLASYHVLLEGKRGKYWRSPVFSIDHDLAMLTGIMDAFLVCMFSRAPKGLPAV